MQKIKGEGKENWTEWDGLDRGRTQMESKETNILIDGAIKGLARKLAPEKFPGIHKNDPS